MRPETKVIGEFLKDRNPPKKEPIVFLTSQGHLIVFNPDVFGLAGVFSIDVILNFSSTYNINTIRQAMAFVGEIKYETVYRSKEKKFVSYLYTYEVEGKIAYLLSQFAENKLTINDLLAKDYFTDKSIKMFNYYIQNDIAYTPLVYKPNGLSGYAKDKPFSNFIVVNPIGSVEDDRNIIPNYEDANLLFNIIMDSGLKNLSFVGMKDGKLTKPIDYLVAIHESVVHNSVESLSDKYLSLSKDLSKKHNLYQDREMITPSDYGFIETPFVIKDDYDDEDEMLPKYIEFIKMMESFNPNAK